MSITKLLPAAMLGSAMLAAGTGVSLAQTDDNGLTRCLRLQRIDHTDVINDSTILFYLRDGTIYRNNLPQRCPDLKAQDRFMYRVTLPELCDVDVITVLNNIGPGYMPGASCGLGKFQAISKETADQITQAAKRGKAPQK